MHSYTDLNGEKHVLSDEDLKKAVNTKIELQKAGNGTCNWNTLCKKLREDGIKAYRCENFRVLVRNYQKGLDKLPSKSKYADFLANHKLALLDSEIGEYNLQKREVQNLKREFGKIKRYVTDIELDKRNLYELAKQSVNIKVPDLTKFKDFKTKWNSMVISLSDLHIGAYTDLPNSQYNKEIAYTYLIQYSNKILEMIEFYKPSEIYIVNLGDMIEGSFMRYNQSFDIELNQSEQQSIAIDYITEFVSKIYSYAHARNITVKYTGIAGNHDRSNGNKKNNLTGDSFITVLNTVIKVMSKKLEGFEFEEPDTPNRTNICVGNKWIKVVHGDLDNLNNTSVLSNLSQVDNLRYEMLLGGHKHSLMIRENNGLVVQSGSIVGNTNYSDALGVSASRSQVVSIIDRVSDTIMPIPVMLNNRKYK